MRKKDVILVALAACLLVAAGAWAQMPTGTVAGRVADANGALPGVTVSATSPYLQGQRTAVTTESGDFIFPLLPPGTYLVKFELAGYQTVEATVKVSAAQTIKLDAEMALVRLADEIVVTGALETISTTNESASTLEAKMVEDLPVGRGVYDSIQLTPGVFATGPRNEAANTYGISVSGSQSYENLFMVNGVVVNENIRGQALPLYIEDAIQETTVTTAGVSAEYGRFAGGVINTLTKSGGNDLSASLRVSFTNPMWSEPTELTVERDDVLNDIYEATLGGFLAKDKLWYFLAGRSVEASTSTQTALTNLPFDQVNSQNRWEGKLTFSPVPDHRLVGSYISIDQQTDNYTFGNVMDLRSLDDRETPQELMAFNYSGVLSDNFFVEAQYSQRQFTFIGSGGDSTDLIDGTVMQSQSNGYRWWSPTFCGVCGDEERNNTNYLLKAAWFASSPSFGSHDVVFGVDRYEDQLLSNNHQSGSDWHIWATSHIIRGDEVYPRIRPGYSTWLIYWPIEQLSQGNNFRTDSAFVNDRWRLNNHWSFNLGLRYDVNDGTNQAGEKVADDSKISPRVGVTWDPKGDGDWIVNASYGTYVNAIAQNAGDQTSGAGNPSIYAWFYQGPAINADPNAPTLVPTGQAIQQVFDWFEANGGFTGNPELFFVDIPGLTTVFEKSLRSPSTDEITIGFAKRLGSKGLFRADFVHRESSDFYMTRIDTTTGQVSDPYGQVYDRRIAENDNDLLERTYDGLHTQFQYRLSDTFTLGGNYTLSRLYGNVNGENAGSGPITDASAEYPEYREMSWYQPKGDLGSDQRHKLILFALWDIISSKHNRLNLSVLERFNSGTPYGALGAADLSGVGDFGYALAPSTNNYWYTARDAYHTEDITSTDISLNYSFKFNMFGADAEIFIQPEVLNVFNEQGVVFADSTVWDNTSDPSLAPFDPFTETPVEGVHWVKGDDFGQATQTIDYQQPRTFRVSVGFRF
jgi:outer membrane receptor protein involved in Fe transport